MKSSRTIVGSTKILTIKYKDVLIQQSRHLSGKKSQDVVDIIGKQIQGSGSLPSNTVANPKGELKAITTRSGLVLDGPSIPMPPPFINPDEDERVEETLTDPEHGKFTIKVPPPLVQKDKPPSQ
ncbi:hypothetical protein Tco_0991691 [Tanacetum coccineum]|uniref:Reverse transcriptase domain-containing protein n=1 Tax=Tanacetum coccineum TaxID=301880 RepID=A0ABQ5F1P5_9ASTR